MTESTLLWQTRIAYLDDTTVLEQFNFYNATI